MSAINQALSELARKKGGKISEIEPVTVKPVKQRLVLPWLIGGFGLSLAVGGWAISYQTLPDMPPMSSVDVDSPIQHSNSEVAIASPTAKATTQGGLIYRAEKMPPPEQSLVPQESHSQTPEIRQQNVLLAKAQNNTVTKKEPSVESVTHGEVVIEQVELSAEQLSAQAQQRAKKALDSNNLDEALAQYQEALKYTPYDVKIRQTLSALYYGKGEVRKSADLLQKGIGLDRDNVALRLSLAKLLMKEQQNAAALTALSALPDDASVEYLSLRGVLAQKNNQDEMALTSYKKLVGLEPESGRWWLGLAIQQERALEFELAEQSYNKALKGLGLSGQSQQFVRDRLAMIKQLESQNSAN